MDILGRNTDNVHIGDVLIEGNLTVDGNIQKGNDPTPPIPTGVFNPLEENLNANNFRISNLGTATQLNDAISLSQANQTYLARTGGSLSGNLNMSNNLITNLGTAINDNDAVNKLYVDTTAQNYLELSGGDMIGDINMGNNLVTNVGNPVNNNDAVNRLYIDVNTIAKPIDETLNMNGFRVTGLGSPIAVSDAVSLNYFNSAAVQNPLSANLNANNNTVINLREPVSSQEAATKNYVDQSIGNPGKIVYINSINDLPPPEICLLQLLYIIPEDTTWFITDNLTLEYGFCLNNNSELRGNQNVTITFDETNRDVFCIFSRADNITIDSLTFGGGGGHYDGFNDPNVINKGFFNCVDSTKTKRFRLLNCNIIRCRRLGAILGYGTVNINNNFINGGGDDKSWYGNVVSTNNNFFDGYPYEIFGGGAVDLYLKARATAGVLTGVDIYSRGSNIVVPSQVQLIDDNGYAKIQQIFISFFIPNIKFGTYMTTNGTHLFVGTPNTTPGFNVNQVDIYAKQVDGIYSFTQTVIAGAGGIPRTVASVCSETGVLYFRSTASGGSIIQVSAWVLGFDPGQPLNYSLVGPVGNSSSLNRYAEGLACYTDISTSNRFVLIGQPNTTVGTGSTFLYVQPAGTGPFQLDFTFSVSNVSNFGTSVSITKNLLAINNLGDKSIYLYPDYLNDPIILRPTDRTTYANWGEVVDISYNSTFNEVRIAISEPNRGSGIVDNGIIYDINTGGVYIYYYDVATQTIKENKTQILEYPEILKSVIISGLGFSMGTSLQFNKNDNANTLIIGAPAYDNFLGVTLVYKFKTSNNSDNGSFFLGQIIYGTVPTNEFGNSVCGSGNIFFIYDDDSASGDRGRVNVFKQGLNIATGSVDINKVSNGQAGILTLSGIVTGQSSSIEHNNNKIVLFAGAQDPFANGSMLYITDEMNAVNITGNIFHPRNYETAIDISNTSRVQLATISSNTFIRTGGVAPLIKYQDSETINTYNHPSVQKFEIEANAGVINSTPILRNIYGQSDSITSATWTNIIYSNPEVNGIFDSSKRFALQCRIDTTVDPQIGDYIRQNPVGLPSRKALIVGKEQKINANYQVIWLTDFTDVFYFDTDVDIINVNNNLIASVGGFYLGDTLLQPSYIYVYIDKDPQDLIVSALLSYTDVGADRTKAFRINFSENGLTYLNDDSLVVYHTNARQSPDRVSVTILDSFKFEYGSRFKIQTQYIDSTTYTIIEGIVTAK
jgi:hypothetical protein